MTKQQQKYLWSILLLLGVSAIAIYFVLKDDTETIINLIKSADIKWLLLGLALIISCFFIEGCILKIFARLYVRKYPLLKGVCNGMIGSFFSGITPSASGGQFAQAYTFSRQGVKVTNAASILFMHFICHQSVLIIYGLIALIVKYNDMSKLTLTINLWGFQLDVITISLIGFAMNVLVMVMLFVLAFSKKLHHLIVNIGIGFLSKLKIIKNPEQKRMDINTKVETFRIELKRLTQNWWVIISVSLLMFVKMTIMNSIPYLMGLAVNVDMTNTIFDGIAMTSFVNMVTAMVPIPGASGGAELVFTMMFMRFFDGTQQTVSAINLLWRFESFYFGLILGALVFIFYRESPKTEAIKADSRTILELEVINIKENQKLLNNPRNDIPRAEIIHEDEIEEHFKSLKEDLKEQLKANEEAISNDKKEEEK